MGQPVALIAHPVADLYGSDRVMLATAAALVDRGWRVVIAIPGDGPLVPLLRDAGAQVVDCPTPVLRKSMLRPAGAVAALRDTVRGIAAGHRLLKSVRPDLLYVSTVTVPLWTALGRLARVPVVCHVHEAETGAGPCLRRLLASPLLLTQGILVNSRFSSRVLGQSFPSLERRATVLQNPVPGPAAPTPPRVVLEGDVRLVFVGRLSPRKGPDVAIDALALLRDRGVSARLTLAGAVFPGYEWFESALRDRVRDLALDDQVVFAGFQPEVWGVLDAADVVLVPSVVDEPFGNTAVEAVLARRPVIVSAQGGLLEAVDGYASALSVPPADPVALADAVGEVVGTWTIRRSAVDDDARLAAQRHGPLQYGDRISEALLAHL